MIWAKAKDGVTNDQLCEMVYQGTFKEVSDIHGYNKVIYVMTHLRDKVIFDKDEEMFFLHNGQRIVVDMDYFDDYMEEL